MIKKIVKNPNIIYIINKYGIFVLTFINSLYIAVKLGVYNLGVWGFINLVIGYMMYASLGIPNALNVLVSKNKSDKIYSEKIYRNSLSLLLCILLLLMIITFLIKNFGWEIGAKYHFADYFLVVFVIIVLNLFNGHLAILLRIYNKVNLISLSQTLYPVFALIVTLFFSGKDLLQALVYVLLLSNVMTTVLYLCFMPFSFRFQWDFGVMKTIQYKGLFLFVYNASFYFIMLSTRTLVSDFYKVEEFGYFTFSFSFANAVILLLTTLSFLLFPKMIAMMASKDNNLVINSIKKVRINYIVFSHLLLHLAIFVFPFFLHYFPMYKNTLVSFQLISLTLIMYNNSFGYQALLMARDKEKLLSLLSFGALLLNVILGLFLTAVLKVDFSYVILCTLITYFCYVWALTKVGRQSLGLGGSIVAAFLEVNQVKISLPYLLSLGMVYFGLSPFWFVVPLVVFIVLNKTELLTILSSGKKLLSNPNVLNI